MMLIKPYKIAKADVKDNFILNVNQNIYFLFKRIPLIYLTSSILFPVLS